MGHARGAAGFLYESGLRGGGIGLCKSEKHRKHLIQKLYRIRGILAGRRTTGTKAGKFAIVGPIAIILFKEMKKA